MVGKGAQTPPDSCFLGWAWFPWAPCLYKKGLEGWSWGSFQAGPLGGQPLLPPACLLSHFSDHIDLSSVHGILQARVWSGLPGPPPRDLSDPGMELVSLMSSALAGGFFSTSATWEAPSPI